ncbi:MAG TPA: DUF294 nucleotidyltransferase-like domain-containing protein, partial [Planctomycetota bacterium]|nr:DUF294 nucleotidyltransferase-like domain-containing protein [Planctomycetota bacterium]
MTIHLDPPPVPLEGPLPLSALRAWIDSAKPLMDSVLLEAAPTDVDGPAAFLATTALPRLPAACLTRTAQIDTLIAALLRRARAKFDTNADAPHPTLLCALGSYGRRELCPHSDIDLLLLHNPATPAERLKEIISAILTPLWDCGLTATHVVYAPADIAILARRLAALDEADPAATAVQKQWTSLLDARPLCANPLTAGENDLAAGLTRACATFRRDHAFSFARHKAREIAERHAALHIQPWESPSPGFLEPNLKDGLGGLRDALATQFILEALEPADPPANLPPALSSTRTSLNQARAQILAARCLLHGAAGRAQERLLQGLQPEVIERLLMQLLPDAWSDEPGERLHAGMALIYDALDRVHLQATAACRRVAQGPRRSRTPTTRQQFDRQNLSVHYSRVGTELHPTAEGEKALSGPTALTVALDGCELALEEQLTPAANWGELLRDSAAIANASPPPAALETFRRILAHPHGLYDLLVWMHRARLLTALIPEFAGVTART